MFSLRDSSIGRLGVVVGAALLALPCAAAAERYVKDGVIVEFSAAPAPGAGALMEGETAELRFRLLDEATGQPLRGATPGAWMDMAYAIQAQDGGEQKSCKDKISLYLRGTVGIRPMVDLNGYYVAVLNRDPSVSIIDPLVSMAGRTSTLARVILPKPGADWVQSADGSRLYVSMPAAGQVAVIDTSDFKLAAVVDAGRRPTRVVLQPDGRYLWVGNDARAADASGVTVIDTEILKPVKHFATGAGHHEIALSEDSRHAFITNRDAGTLTRVDVRALELAGEAKLGGVPISVGYSALSKAAYVADGRQGVVTVLGGPHFAPGKRIALRPGLGPLRFTPDGRYALVTNPGEDLVHVIDASSNERVHDIGVKGQPYQVAFTSAFAYVRALASERVTMINLLSLERGATPVLQSFAAGTVPPRAAGELPLADSLSAAATDAAMLVVNPGDNTTYFYMEGMNAPMSNYQSQGASARAVTVIDRSLQELEPGVYTSRVRIPAAGRYDVAFALNTPRLLHCFSAEAQANPAMAPAQGRVAVEFMLDKREVPLGATVPVRFRIKDAATGAPKAGLDDVRVLSYLVPGQRRAETFAKEVGPGVYEAPVAIAEHGAYSIRVASKRLGKDYRELAFTTLRTARPDLDAELKRRLTQQKN